MQQFVYFATHRHITTHHLRSVKLAVTIVQLVIQLLEIV